MVDLAIGQLELYSASEVRADVVANKLKSAWFTRYSHPNQIVRDSGKEFLAEFKPVIVYLYDCISRRYLCTRIIHEKVHQTIGNII